MQELKETYNLGSLIRYFSGCIRVYTNYPNWLKAAPSLRIPLKVNPKSKMKFHFGSLACPLLLCSVVSYIGSLFLVTDCSVSYKLSNVLVCSYLIQIKTLYLHIANLYKIKL